MTKSRFLVPALSGALALVVVMSVPVLASECQMIDPLRGVGAEQAESAVARLRQTAGAIVDATPGEVSGWPDMDCAFSDRLPPSAYCQWQFPLRVAGAAELYGDLNHVVQGCLGSQGQRDDGVNHPDFYEAMLYEVEGNTLTVSLKDKSVLDATLVTLRLAWPAPR